MKMVKDKKILVGADFAGFPLKEVVVEHLTKKVWKILEHVKKNYGFDHEGEKLLIQFYPSKDGGCELFVTKLGILPTASERTIAKSDRITMLTTKRSLYRFESLEELILAVKLIKDTESAKYSEVFLGEFGEYYLEIMERGASRGCGISEFDRLSEFSEKVDKSRYPYITEHCKKLTDGDAIKVFASL